MGSDLRRRRLLDTALGAAFLAGLCAPALDFALRPMEARSAERELRTPARPPGAVDSLARLLGFPERAERWWNDWFGLRDLLIGARNAFYWNVLELSPTDHVVRGEGGWVFYQGAYRALDADRGARPLAEHALGAWRRVFEARRAWCEARGIQLVVAIVPSKARVYPERLPRGFETLGPARARAVRAALGAEWGGIWLDLEPVLARARELDAPGDFAYWPLGTHWTDRGAFAAYRALAGEIARRHPALAPLEPGDLEVVPDPTGGDSWADRMYLEGVLTQTARSLQLKRGAASAEPRTAPEHDARYTCAGAPVGKAYVLHDSFGTSPCRWLAEHFRETWTMWTYDFDVRRIEAFAPDVVVMLFSDRYFVLGEPVLGADELADARAAGGVGAARTPLWRFDAGARAAELEPEGALTVEAAGDGARLRSERASGYVRLPPLAFEGGGPWLVRIVIDSPAETTLDLFFRPRGAPRFTRAQTVAASLHPGTNDVLLELPTAGDLAGLALRPGSAAGAYLLRSVEVSR